jgi:hypothetical protein
MEEETYGVSGTNPNKELMGALAMLAKSSSGGQKAFDAASAMYAPVEEANPWEASLRFFLEMGKQASQPGATVLGSAVGSGLVPLDYLTAKKKEKRDRDQKVASTAMSLAPSLAPKAATYRDPKEYMIEIPVLDDKGKPTGAFQPAYRDFLTAKGFADLQKQGARFKSVDKTTGTGSTFKERKFYKTGFDPAVVKNENDAADFEAQGWSSVPPVDWTDSKGATSEDAAEVQSSKILDSGVVVTVMKDGTSKVLDGVGNELTGNARTDAIRIAEERGIEIQGKRSQQRALGGLSSEIVGDSYKDMLKVRTNIATLEDAKRALESGAQTGFFAQFLPDISRSATELANVRGRLGLEVVGSVTFGALSKGELDLALDIGLPENMDEDYLKGWVQERIDAKKKLLLNLQEAASFLSKGNSIGDWMVELEKRETTSQEEITEYAVEISEMSAAEIDAIDLETAKLSNAELKAYIARSAELESGDN